jgi:hypothetical protein
MAEIKSSLELALERAAALGDSDKDGAAREEAAGRGKVWARKVLNGDLSAQGLIQELNAVPQDEMVYARKATGEHLLEKLPQAWPLAGPALELLAGSCGAREPVARLGREIASMDKAISRAEEQMRDEMTQAYGLLGISGGALRTNPKACADYEQRINKVLAGPRQELDKLRAQVIDCLEAGTE